MSIRAIQKEDLESCAVLYAGVFSSAPWNEPWTKKAAFERLRHFYESKGFVGVLADMEGAQGLALGNVEPFHTGDLFYFREMCIATERQSQGLGRRVFSALEVALESRGVTQIYLATERAIPAARFYLKNGFKIAEEMAFCTKSIDS